MNQSSQDFTIEKISSLPVKEAISLGFLLENAFKNAKDPNFVFDDPDRKEAMLRPLYSAGLQKISENGGEIWVAKDKKTNRYVGCSVLVRSDYEPDEIKKLQNRIRNLWLRREFSSDEWGRRSDMHEAIEQTQSKALEGIKAPYLELYFIGVHEDFQRRGIGGALLNKAIEQTRKADTALWLDLFIPNPELIKFYENHGCTVVEQGKVEGTDLAFQSMVFGDLNELKQKDAQIISKNLDQITGTKRESASVETSSFANAAAFQERRLRAAVETKANIEALIKKGELSDEALSTPRSPSPQKLLTYYQDQELNRWSQISQRRL